MILYRLQIRSEGKNIIENSVQKSLRRLKIYLETVSTEHRKGHDKLLMLNEKYIEGTIQIYKDQNSCYLLNG